MPHNLLFPLILGGLFLVSAAVFQFMPKLPAGMMKFRRGFALGYLAEGIYCLAVALIVSQRGMSTDTLTWVLLTGIVAIGFVVMIPCFIAALIRDMKTRINEERRKS